MKTLLLTLFITFSTINCEISNSTCDGFQASLNLKILVGTWYVVAIVPEKSFPDKEITCYKVEFSETDGAGLRWLMNKTKTTKKLNVGAVNGTIVRQRYHSEQAFDVWSKAVEGINGCFQQVLSLDVGDYNMLKATTHNAMMQLHLVEEKNSAEVTLMQLLWGKMISVVIYRRHQGITQEQLRPVMNVLTKLRGPQRLPKLCHSPLKDLLFP